MLTATEKNQKKLALKKRLVAFTVAMLRLVRRFEKDRVLAPIFNQIIRSAGSIGANMSEASGSVTRTGYAHYFNIALQSANETRYWLEVLREAGLPDAKELERLDKELSEFIGILVASIRTLRGRM